MTNTENSKRKGKTSVNTDLTRRIVEFISDSAYTPLYAEEIANALHMERNAQNAFAAALSDALSNGTAVLTKKGKVMAAVSAGLVYGVFEASTRGFGFVRIEGDDADVFIPPDGVSTAIHGDGVLCTIAKRGKPNDEGRITKIVSTTSKPIVGSFIRKRRHGAVVPDDKRFPELFIHESACRDVQSGQKVIAVMTKRSVKRTPEGKISEVLGNPDEIGMDVLAIVASHEIPFKFPKSALNEADATPNTVSKRDIANRRDFRALPTITIDGADTKDIDDAISLETLDDDNTRLYVHIADVAHYVRPGTALWKEAQLRGTSVYLADRVIPMLPKQLSNGICSLNPRVDRLTLSCIMTFDKQGRVIAHEICEGVINSDAAVTYDEVALALEQPSPPPFYAEMARLANILKERREKAGALEFGFAECKLTVDAAGRVTDVSRRPRNAATSVIEEFMIAANEVVATQYHWLDLPFIYRVHEEPDRSKIQSMMDIARNFGYSMKGGKALKNLQSLLERSQGRPDAMLVSKMVLRSLKQARYSPVAQGHFGLAKAFYSHFTSPIRRFPDLWIHMLIKAHLASKLNDKTTANAAATLAELCKAASDAERRADACAWDVEKLKKVEFMSDKIGQVFSGIISHVIGRGFFVELDNTIEGFVTTDSLHDDVYVFHESRSALIGRRRNKAYTIGDKVRIVVAKADAEERRLDFYLK